MRRWMVDRRLSLTGMVSLGLGFGGCRHEQYGLQQASVTLGDDETRSIAFSFEAE